MRILLKKAITTVFRTKFPSQTLVENVTGDCKPAVTENMSLNVESHQFERNFLENLYCQDSETRKETNDL